MVRTKDSQRRKKSSSSFDLDVEKIKEWGQDNSYLFDTDSEDVEFEVSVPSSGKNRNQSSALKSGNQRDLHLIIFSSMRIAIICQPLSQS